MDRHILMLYCHGCHIILGIMLFPVPLLFRRYLSMIRALLHFTSLLCCITSLRFHLLHFVYQFDAILRIYSLHRYLTCSCTHFDYSLHQSLQQSLGISFYAEPLWSNVVGIDLQRRTMKTEDHDAKQTASLSLACIAELQ